MTTGPEQEHLRLLSIFHYVWGGVTLATALLALPHIGMGLWALQSPELFESGDGDMPAEVFGWMFLGFGLFFLALGLLYGLVVIGSGRCLAKRKGYWFSFVVACVECLMVPIGTVLGVFTLITLSKDTVKALYGRQ
ncbi:MAG: hypothetical protein O2890_08330 [Cyanobacteria bacterium]|nr:hypothetical protein [Cyanobacteriota bacterium]MDA0866412.1 hypothetical protein [Cyanobacteriota bacterium]